jgi:hypothetical protein
MLEMEGIFGWFEGQLPFILAVRDAEKVQVLDEGQRVRHEELAGHWRFAGWRGGEG